MGFLQDAAGKGRGGDTRVAHVTPGEVVIPKEVVAIRPDLVRHVMTQLKQMGGNPKNIIVGRGRVNPSTGIEEFATAEEVEAAYNANAQVGANAGNNVNSPVPTYGVENNQGSPAEEKKFVPLAINKYSIDKTGLTREIDPVTETIEGRINKLLGANNPVIMQAKNRALQDFHKRGLLDTSMASQAAQEAMTAKAIDIASPDAAAYQTQGMLNQTEGNKSTMLDQEYWLKGQLQGQTDAAALERAIAGQQTQDTSTNARMFTEGILNINKDYAARVETIQQNTVMNAAQKADAIQTQTDLRDSSIQAWNAASRSLPGWKEEWAVIPSYSAASAQPVSSAQPDQTDSSGDAARFSRFPHHVR
jgi:hypothetical protein